MTTPGFTRGNRSTIFGKRPSYTSPMPRWGGGSEEEGRKILKAHGYTCLALVGLTAVTSYLGWATVASGFAYAVALHFALCNFGMVLGVGYVLFHPVIELIRWVGAKIRARRSQE